MYNDINNTVIWLISGCLLPLLHHFLCLLVDTNKTFFHGLLYLSWHFPQIQGITRLVQIFLLPLQIVSHFFYKWAPCCLSSRVKEAWAPHILSPGGNATLTSMHLSDNRALWAGIKYCHKRRQNYSAYKAFSMSGKNEISSLNLTKVAQFCHFESIQFIHNWSDTTDHITSMAHVAFTGIHLLPA